MKSLSFPIKVSILVLVFLGYSRVNVFRSCPTAYYSVLIKRKDKAKPEMSTSGLQVKNVPLYALGYVVFVRLQFESTV